MTNEARVLRYLERMFAADPAAEAERLVAQRLRFVGALAEDEAPRISRDAIAARLEDLRRRAEELTPPQWTEEVRGLPLADQPDLSAWARRIQAVVAARCAFVDAANDRGVDPQFLRNLRRIAAAPPSEAVVERESLLAGLAGPSLRRARRCARRLRSRHAALAALDTELFARLETLKKDRRLATRTRRIGFSLLIAFVVVRACVRILRQDGG